MGVTLKQRAEVEHLRDAHLQRLHNLQVARHQLTANDAVRALTCCSCCAVCCMRAPIRTMVPLGTLILAA